MKYIFVVILLLNSCLSASVSNVVTLKGILEAANSIRANPKNYANIIQTQIRDKMDTNGLHGEWGLQFNEGTTAVDEAINFLNNIATPQPALTLDQGLTRSSWEHSKWQIDENSQNMSHVGPTGRNSLQDRFNLYNTYTGANSWAENIANAQSNWYNTATLLCLQWIIDDGVTNRGHRTNFFTTDKLKVGIGIYPFTKTGTTQKNDRVTFFYAKGSTCTNCSGFSQTLNNNMCWSNFAANMDSCDPSTIPVSSGTTSSGETTTPTSSGETTTPTSSGGTNNPTTPTTPTTNPENKNKSEPTPTEKAVNISTKVTVSVVFIGSTAFLLIKFLPILLI